MGPLVETCSPDPERPIAVAVSGGSDSMALFWHLSGWAERARRPLHVLSVDHGLRAESTEECRFVASQSARAGHDCVLLSWDGHQSGQAAARQGRHRLLAKAARQAGAKVLCLGHTLDDVVETLLMRRRRGVKSASQAGPVLASASPVWPHGRGLAMVRPLLLSRRLALRHWLEQGGRHWIDDPSNANPAYERARLRQQLSRHPDWREPLGRLALLALRRRHAAGASLAAVLRDRQHVRVDPDGLIRFDGTGLDHSRAALALGVLIRVASGGDRLPRPAAVSEVLGRIARPGDRMTIGGAWLQKSRGGLLIGRDPGAARARLVHGLWDGRYEADATAPERVPVAPLLRQSAPPGSGWREVLSDRLDHEAALMDLSGQLA